MLQRRLLSSSITCPASSQTLQDGKLSHRFGVVNTLAHEHMRVPGRQYKVARQTRPGPLWCAREWRRPFSRGCFRLYTSASTAVRLTSNGSLKIRQLWHKSCALNGPVCVLQINPAFLANEISGRTSNITLKWSGVRDDWEELQYLCTRTLLDVLWHLRSRIQEHRWCQGSQLSLMQPFVIISHLGCTQNKQCNREFESCFLVLWPVTSLHLFPQRLILLVARWGHCWLWGW